MVELRACEERIGITSIDLVLYPVRRSTSLLKDGCVSARARLMMLPRVTASPAIDVPSAGTLMGALFFARIVVSSVRSSVKRKSEARSQLTRRLARRTSSGSSSTTGICLVSETSRSIASLSRTRSRLTSRPHVSNTIRASSSLKKCVPWKTWSKKFSKHRATLSCISAWQ